MKLSPAEEFDALLRGHVRVLYRYAYRWTGDPNQAEDLVQETLTRLFGDLEQLRQVEQVRPWAARVMYRLFVDGLRRARRSPVSYVGRSGSTGELLDDEGENDAADQTWDPAVVAGQAMDREKIIAVWARLHEQHRVVLSLHDIEGYSLEEVAAIVGVPLGTAKSRLNRARHRLRELLTEGTDSISETRMSPEVPMSGERGG
jgi:RNA polymerase sigma factor (sigma-70 family)